jgi:hypothetical protein
MGNRVAEMKTPGCGDIEGYCVYQSTSMACFTPIFHNQLAAELFALALDDIRLHWDEKPIAILAADVNEVILGEYGEKPEDHSLYYDTLSDPQNMDNLLQYLREHRRAVKS